MNFHLKHGVEVDFVRRTDEEEALASLIGYLYLYHSRN